jgi:hypothetical protein
LSFPPHQTFNLMTQVIEAFLEAAKFVPACPHYDVIPPVNIPSTARRIVGDVLGWPLHLKHRHEENGSAIVPIMRHKPGFVQLVDHRKKTGFPSSPTNSSSTSFGLKRAFDEISEGADPQNFLNRKIRRILDGKIVEGTVVKIEEYQNINNYIVIYEDGKQESLVFDQIKRYMIKNLD